MPWDFYMPETAKIIAKAIIAGPFGVIHPGCMAEVPASLAKELVRTGKAEWPPSEAVDEAAALPEVADAPPIEIAEPILPKKRTTQRKS